MNANLRSTGLLLMPEHRAEGCAWCNALDRRNALVRDKRLIAAALLALLALIGWELSR